MNEFRRLINRKVVIGFIALLIINVSLYVYQQTKGAGIKELRFETAQRQWCVDYYGNYDIEVAINAVDSDIKRILSYLLKWDSNVSVRLLRGHEFFHRVMS